MNSTFSPAAAEALGAGRRCGAGDLGPKEVSGDQKEAAACRGLVMFGDEASFWLDGSLHRTWARVGVQPHVDTFGQRKTAHVFGAVSVEKRPRFHHLFATVFNGETFLEFLKHLVKGSRRKLFLIIDKDDGKAWLREPSSHRAVSTPAVLAQLQPDGRCLEGGQEAHHAQPLLQNHA
ncbi:MAG: transposase [Deltaproteobacteria bacterium]|nr:transposase [Deltaproteobacteria bacterium]